MKDKINSFWLALQYVLSIIIAFLMIKINIIHFGQELFGMWLIFFSIWNMGIALDLGFGTSLIRFIAEANSKNDKKDISELVSNGLIFYAAIGILIFIICIVILNLFVLNNQNIVPFRYFQTAKEISVLLGINFYLQYLAYSFRSAYEGVSNFVISSRILLLYNFLNLFVVISVMLLNLSMVSMAFGLICSSLTYLMISIILFKKIHEEYTISVFLIKKTTINRILKFSVHVQLASIFNALIEPTIKYIIGNNYSLSLVTIYDIGRKVTISISGLFFATFKTLLPKVSSLIKKEEAIYFFNNKIAEISKLGLVYSGLMMGILPIIIAGIIKVFFISNSILLILVILSLPETINNFGYPIYIFLLGIGRASVLAFIQFINLLLTIISLLIGFIVFNSPIGLIGYFISVLIGNILMLFFIKKIYLIDLKLFLSKVGLQKFIIFIIMLLSVTIGNYLNEKLSIINFALLSVASLLLFYNDLKGLSKQLRTFLQYYSTKTN